MGDATGEMRSLLGRGATMSQVAAFVEEAIDDAARRLQPPDDTAMATSMRCLGCNQPYRSMHARAANAVAHAALPGLVDGPSSAAPETRKVYRDQYGVLLVSHELTNAELEKRKKAHDKDEATRSWAERQPHGRAQVPTAGGLSLPGATGRAGSGGSSGGGASGGPRVSRGGGLKPLGQVHVPHAPVHTARNKLPLAATPQQLSASGQPATTAAKAGSMASAEGPGGRMTAAQRKELGDVARQREGQAAQQYLSGGSDDGGSPLDSLPQASA
jgi:hypothetical protein